MNNIDLIERDLDPPQEDPRNVRIKNYWVTYQWDDGRTEELDWIDKRIEDVLDEIEYEANCEINQELAQKYGEPQEEY
jgi:hypothetical protein